ncbi:MAG: DUF3073 domain-containing protein [Propionibacteriaceae bacterium]
MGRGRQKAKQTKVARDLKYRSVETDFERLQRELSGGADPFALRSVVADDDAEGEDDPYAEYADIYGDDDEDDE